MRYRTSTAGRPVINGWREEGDVSVFIIAELEAWEREIVYPLAQERISIDRDDGVKVNYNRFPRALAKVAGLSEWR